MARRRTRERRPPAGPAPRTPSNVDISVPVSPTGCLDPLCLCDGGGGGTETDRLLRRARRLLNLIITDDVWTTLDDRYLASIVYKAEDLGDLIAIAQRGRR